MLASGNAYSSILSSSKDTPVTDTKSPSCSSCFAMKTAMVAGLVGIAVALGGVYMAALHVDPTANAARMKDQAVSRDESIDGFYMTSFNILVKTYYGGRGNLLSASFGPAGTVIGKAVIDGSEQTLIMLPDARTLVRGEIHSMFLPADGGAARSDAPAPGMASRGAGNTPAAVISPAQKDTDQKADAPTISARTGEAEAARNAAPPKITPPEGMKSAMVPNKPAIYAAAAKSGGYVAFGTGPKKLYVFFDPNCPACREASSFINKKVAGSEVEVRYLPLSILGPDSQDKAAYMLDVKDNTERMARFDAVHAPKKMAELVPGFSYKAAPNGDKGALVNFALLKATGQVSTPRFMYLTSAGPMISVINSEQGLMEIVQSVVPE